jgi:hypothetical protein
VEGNNARKVVLKLLRLIDGEYGEVQSTANAGVGAPCSCLEVLPEIERIKSDMISLQSKILNHLGLVEGKLKQNIVEKGSLSNVIFLLHGNLHSDDNSSMLETIDFDVCEAPIVSTAPVNKDLINGSESPLIENANSKEFADNINRQGYDNNSIINNISNGDIDDNSSRLGAIDLDICEVPIVSTAPVNKQLTNESESPIIEIANSKEIDDDSSNRIHNNSIINSTAMEIFKELVFCRNDNKFQ